MQHQRKLASLPVDSDALTLTLMTDESVSQTVSLGSQGVTLGWNSSNPLLTKGWGFGFRLEFGFVFGFVALRSIGVLLLVLSATALSFFDYSFAYFRT